MVYKSKYSSDMVQKRYDKIKDVLNTIKYHHNKIQNLDKNYTNAIFGGGKTDLAKLMKDIGYGKEYAYSHNYPENFVNQEFLPEEISGKKLYNPGNNPRENQFRDLLRKRWKDKYGY